MKLWYYICEATRKNKALEFKRNNLSNEINID